MPSPKFGDAAPGSDQDTVERRAQVDLAACCRLFAQLGIANLTTTHLSARVPGTEDRFLVNPQGMLLDEITASGLAVVDETGHALVGGEAVDPGDFAVHAAIYAARPEIMAVFHLHGAAGCVVSALEEGLLPLHRCSMQFHERLAYHYFASDAAEAEERERLAADLGSRFAMIMRNDGLLTAGRTMQEAFILMYRLEQSCSIQVGALSTGRPLVVPNPEICESTAQAYEADGAAIGQREWPALVRLLDRLGADYAR